VVIGEGKHRPELETRASRLGLTERVSFRGQLKTAELVRRELDQAHLFVMPSHQEGLPKAMVEAMARGLPCIGSAVGGIPELLPPEDLVAPGDADALADKIREVVTSPERMAQMSSRNLEKAREYSDHLLRARRIRFYEQLRDETSRWLKAQSASASNGGS
jgi:glycosyltransferase involved in cell wall biosynthesis